MDLTTIATVDSPQDQYPIVSNTVPSDPNYNITFEPGTLIVSGKQIPKILWEQPQAITFGELLGDAQLNATVEGGIPGTWDYTPKAGARFDAGSYPLSVTLTPTDSESYATATASVILTVKRASLLIIAKNQQRLPGEANAQLDPVRDAIYDGFVL